MANAFISFPNTLYIKVLTLKKSLINFYRFVLCAVYLVLSASNRGFLSPLSIFMFSTLFLSPNTVLFA